MAPRSVLAVGESQRAGELRFATARWHATRRSGWGIADADLIGGARNTAAQALPGIGMGNIATVIPDPTGLNIAKIACGTCIPRPRSALCPLPTHTLARLITDRAGERGHGDVAADEAASVGISRSGIHNLTVERRRMAHRAGAAAHPERET